jgi:hypothetical protein
MTREPVWYISALLYLIAIIVFVLAAFGAQVGSTSPTELVAAGLAFFAAAHLLP